MLLPSASRISSSVGLRIAAQQAGRGHDEARRAVAALGAELLVEAALHGRQRAALARATSPYRRACPRRSRPASGRRASACRRPAPCRRRTRRRRSRSWCRSGPPSRADSRAAAGCPGTASTRFRPLRVSSIIDAIAGPSQRWRGFLWPLSGMVIGQNRWGHQSILRHTDEARQPAAGKPTAPTVGRRDRTFFAVACTAPNVDTELSYKGWAPIAKLGQMPSSHFHSVSCRRPMRPASRP